MAVINHGEFKHWVDLDDPDPDTKRVIKPSRVKCSIKPAQPGPYDQDKVTHFVRMPFHPGIRFNTRIRHTDARGSVHHLFVRGIQNDDLLDQYLNLLCEEVWEP